MRTRHLSEIALLALLMVTPLAQAECSVSSGPKCVALLELYTSEGCSSCPPADRWLSGIAAAGLTADKVVPLAFHVDYWDYIGWKDRFAQPTFTARQHEAAAANRSGFVYTPQVLFNGSDFRGWGSHTRFSRQVAAANRLPARADLGLSLDGSNAIKVSARIRKAEDRQHAAVFVAVYENGLQSEVNAGENRGRRLHHDYVVRGLYGPYALDSKSGTWERSLPLRPEWQRRDAGVVAFAQDRASGEVLQALALKMCGG